jgi:hypothetical protein
MRLLTLTAPSGTAKTCLALALATHLRGFADAVTSEQEAGSALRLPGAGGLYPGVAEVNARVVDRRA